MEAQSSTPETDKEECAHFMGHCVTREFARKLEHERDEARNELAAVKEVLWPNQTGLPNEHRDAALAVSAIKRLSEKALLSKDAQILALREALQFIYDTLPAPGLCTIQFEGETKEAVTPEALDECIGAASKALAAHEDRKRHLEEPIEL